MATRFTVHFEGVGEVMRAPGVRAELRAAAGRVAGRARSIAAAEGVAASITTSDGTRPRGRPYSRVASDRPDAEFGSSKSARLRVLGRAVESSGS
ncbi:hypothetical protein ACFQE5_01830 [Pseudonocardia hispaniensis]|uniref:Uncharacterized protein n=1 Tax=Pseudonocardia hispaniensis TaxID=904933 RepID=A0ABW1IX98_9PSEU